MKLFLALATTIATVSAFTTNPHLTAAPSSTQMMMADGDSPLVKKAMKLTKELGADSAMAKLAWEAVEEVNSSDNSAATKGSLADECDTENVSDECVDYNEKLEQVQELIAANGIPESSTIRTDIASTVAPVKLSAPSTKAAPQSKELKAALKEARSLTASKGISSKEAIFAWETVEEIASAGTSNAVGDVLSSEECLVFEEASKEACNALEELSKITDAK